MENLVFPFPEFETQRLKIVKYRMQFVQDAFEFYNDEETMRYAGPEVHKTISETEEFIKNHLENKVSNLLLWGVIYKNNGKMIGDISLAPDYKHKYASLGSILNKNYLQMGIMYEATKPVFNYAFNELNLNRIEAQICTHHIASVKYVEKLGLVNEGILRQNFMIKGVLYDSYMYALLKQDFKY
jgi:[ribosomal protein S5]-alanine N-acetyltransferase